MVELRDYQARGVEEIRAAMRAGKRRVLFVLPTGGGKTVCFAHVTAATVAKGKRICILVHRQELIEQVSAALTREGVEHGLIASGEPMTDRAVQVASVQSLARRLDKVAPFDLIVPDEAHHSNAATWRSVLDAMPDAFVLGTTASPERSDGQGLGDVYQTMILGPSTADLTSAGFLVPAVVYAPPEPPDLSGIRTRAGDFAADDLSSLMSGGGLTGRAVDHYQRLCPGVPAVAFCVDVNHSQQTAQRFRDAGIRAAHVDGKTPKAERKALIASLGTGDLDVLCNCGLISEGVDIPAIGAALLLRPTQSLAMFLQQVGRALRTSPGKTRALILDHAGNTLRHGLPDEPREWTLDAKPRRGREAKKPSDFRRCEACEAWNPRKLPHCQACGEPLKPSPQEIAETEAELARAEHDSLVHTIRRMSGPQIARWADGNRDRLTLARTVKGFKPGWVAHALRDTGHHARHYR